MDLIYTILQKGINLGATDIHLAPGIAPVFRINRKLVTDNSSLPLNPTALNSLVEFFEKEAPNLTYQINEKKQADFPFKYKNYRFRINLSYTKSRPTFSIRLIPNGNIDIEGMGINDIIRKMKRVTSGLILLTGRVNSGKSTTMNAFLQEINKEETKKIVTIEDPIEYEHESDKCIVIQKEVGPHSDVISYKDGLMNLLREDSDINVIGEIRDRKTMDVAIDLAESGGLVIGTLHTRSCGETVDRIVNMYEPADQQMVKSSVSSILKMVVSQKLLRGTQNNLVLVPEIMIVNSTIAALIRQESFSISDIEDAIHSLRDVGCLSYEYSFAELYLQGKLDMKTIRENTDQAKLDIIKGLIVNSGGTIGI